MTDYSNPSLKAVNKSVLLASSLIAMLAVGNCANAQITIGPTNSSTTPSHTTEFTSFAGNDVLTFNKFNGTLGTLLSVAITVNGSVTSVVSVSNDPQASSNSTGNSRTNSTFTFVDPLSLMSLQADVFTNKFFYTNLAPNSTATSGTLTGSVSNSGSYNNTQQNILNEFTGAGTIKIGASTFTQTVLSNTGGNASSSQATSGTINGTITYTYISVPESGTVIVLTCGTLMGVAVLSRRRKLARQSSH